jgi:hypothetical protein
VNAARRNERELIDESVLTRLIDELYGHRDAVIRFAVSFAADLPSRCRRMRTAFDSDDREVLFEVGLSIRTSAQMAGARRLAKDARALHEAARTASRFECAREVAAVEATAAVTIPALERAADRLRGL